MQAGWRWLSSWRAGTYVGSAAAVIVLRCNAPRCNTQRAGVSFGRCAFHQKSHLDASV
jgi:hypothetical protein